MNCVRLLRGLRMSGIAHKGDEIKEKKESSRHLDGVKVAVWAFVQHVAYRRD